MVEILHEPNLPPLADIVFLHGLDGDALETWTHSNGEIWPNWLAKEMPRLRLMSVNHPSNKFASVFDGGGLGIVDRSNATLSLLKTYDLGIRPTIFIAHSLGGLITKGILRKAHDIGGDDNNKILDNIAGIIFLATPHKGSALGNVLSKLKGISSNVVEDLRKGTDQLKDLQDWYVHRADEKSIKTQAFSEGHKTGSLTVVDQDSSHPGTTDGFPISVDANHVEICKFKTINDATYRMIRQFIVKRLEELEIDPKQENNESNLELYTSLVEGDRMTLEEKLTDGGRSDEIKTALREKERIAIALHRNAISVTARTKYKNFFGDIVSRFRLAVLPEIYEGKSRGEVNEKLQTAVIDQVRTTDHELATQDDIHASIYYLTGNCHISWSNPDD